jgi:hypothetical protein
MERIMVIGAGTMGNGIAHVFALAGYDVHLVDLNADSLRSGMQAIEKNLNRQVSKGAVTQEDAGAALRRIRSGEEMEPGDADVVVEAVTERQEVKAHVFRALDEKVKPGALLASNTSSISLTWLGAQTKRPDRVIGMHFFNPVPMMKLVEIVRGLETSDEAYACAEARQDACLGAGLPRLRLQPGAYADDQRGGLLRHGERRLAGGCGHRHEARDGTPDGTPRARRPNWPGRVPGYHGSPPPQPRRRQVPPLPAPPENGHRRPHRPEVRAGVLLVQGGLTPVGHRAQDSCSKLSLLDRRGLG